MSQYDVLFLGSSPNALAAAARLARSGLRTLVLETRDSVGGPVATETFAPGFRADTGVMSVTLDPEITRDLELTIDVIRRDSVTRLDAAPLTLRATAAPSSWRGAKPPVDFAAIPGLPASAGHAVDLVQALHRNDPPDMPAPSGAAARSLRNLGARLLGFGARETHEVLRLLFMSAREFLEQEIGSEAVRAVLAGVAVRALSEGPFAAGTLWSLLHHWALGDGLFRSTARGGVQSVAEALADKARAFGAEVRAGVAGPLRVDVSGGVARGVVLPGGQRIKANVVVSDYDARVTFTRFVAPPELDPEINVAIRNYRYRGSVARVHLALRALPEFIGVDPDAIRGTLVVAPDVASLERAWDEAKRGAPSSQPYVEVALPTVGDATLAPEGQHVLSAWVQYVPHGRGDRKSVLKSVLDRLAPFAPGLAGLVSHHHVSLPEDLERQFGLSGGHLYGGEITLAQAFFSRPLPGFSHYETPVANLYLGGSAAHPGGYSGRSGWNLSGLLLSRPRSRAE